MRKPQRIERALSGALSAAPPSLAEPIGGDEILVSQEIAGHALDESFVSRDDVRSHHRLEDAVLQVESPSLQEKHRIV